MRLATRGNRNRRGALSLVSRVGSRRAPLAGRAATRAAVDMYHCAFIAHEQPQELDEAGAVEAAGGAVGRRLNRNRIADARHGPSLLEREIGTKHGARRAARGDSAEQSHHAGRPFHRPARGAALVAGSTSLFKRRSEIDASTGIAALT